MSNLRHTEKSKISSFKATDPLVRGTETVLTDTIIDIYQDDSSSTQNPNRERPLLAAFLCLLSACFFTLNFLSAKVVYGLYPSYSPMSMLFMRALAASVFIVPQAIFVNYSTKKKIRSE